MLKNTSVHREVFHIGCAQKKKEEEREGSEKGSNLAEKPEGHRKKRQIGRGSWQRSIAIVKKEEGHKSGTEEIQGGGQEKRRYRWQQGLKHYSLRSLTKPPGEEKREKRSLEGFRNEIDS